MNENLKFRILTFIRYMGDGFFYPFIALYLMTTGLTEKYIGILLSLTPMFAIILNPVYTKLCSNTKRTKIVLGIISIIEGIFISIIGFTNDKIFISVLSILIAVFGCCHYGLMDSLVAIRCDKDGTKYSSIRLFGSGSYIIATALGGYVCNIFSYGICFIVCAIMFIISGFIYFKTKTIEVTQSKEASRGLKDYIAVLKNKKYVLMMIFYAFSYAIFFTCKNFFPTYLETRGIDSSQYGLVYSYLVIIELAVLMILGVIKKKLNPYLMLIIATISGMIMIFTCFSNAPVWLVIGFSAFRGVMFAIYLSVFYPYFVSKVGQSLGTTATMLATLVYSCCLLLFNTVNGFLIENPNIGYSGFYLIMFIIMAMLLIYMIILFIADKKQSKKESL